MRELKQKEKYKNMLKRKNKEKNVYKTQNSTLKIKYEGIKKLLEKKDKEIERLNNIINELEKDFIEKINYIKNNYSQVNGNYFNMSCVIETYEDALDKLQELKGDESNGR